MAAYSAIEYFYSYWFWERDGLSKLIYGFSKNNQLLSEHKKLLKKLKNIQSSSDSTTPAISQVIRFFVNDLNIEGKKYMDMDSEDIPLFIKVRKELLPGSFI
jgi:hypothetical protein